MEYQFFRVTYKSIGAIGVLIASILVSGCIDLAVNDGKNKLASHKKTSFVKGEVYTMRGGLGGVFSKGMNRLEDTLEVDYRIHSSSTVWYKANALSSFIIEQYKSNELHGPIILVGHSLGANEQIKVARNLARANIPVALLMTIDAVSPLTVPPNVAKAVNIYKPSFVPMFSGLVLKAMDPTSTHIDNINVATLKDADVNHFTIDSNKTIQQVMVDSVLATLKTTNSKSTI